MAKPSIGRIVKLVASGATVTSLLVACYGLDDSFPFACAQDHSCPDGYTCKHGTCFTNVYSYGASCPAGYAVAWAPPAKSSSSTSLYRQLPETCAPTCGSDGKCPTGFNCVAGLTQGNVCVDCSTSADCPAGQCCAKLPSNSSFGELRFGCQDPSNVATLNRYLCSQGEVPAACTVAGATEVEPTCGSTCGSAGGSGGAFSRCSKQSDCASGLVCVDNNGDKVFFCKPTCTSISDCAPYHVGVTLQCLLATCTNGATATIHVCDDRNTGYLAPSTNGAGACCGESGPTSADAGAPVDAGRTSFPDGGAECKCAH